MLVSEELKEKNVVSQVGIKNYKKEPNENSGAEKYSDYMKNWLEVFLTDWSKQKKEWFEVRSVVIIKSQGTERKITNRIRETCGTLLSEPVHT